MRSRLIAFVIVGVGIAGCQSAPPPIYVMTYPAAPVAPPPNTPVTTTPVGATPVVATPNRPAAAPPRAPAGPVIVPPRSYSTAW
jgi:hypothetical protein